MIPLTRDRRTEAIPPAFRGPKKLAKDRQAMELWRQSLQNQGAKIEWDTAYWKAAKKQLKAESHQKCAYCEANAAVVAHGDVEHYRPKSVYWWLAYTYDNYLYACQICNQSYKGDHFPIGGAQWTGPALDAGTSDAEIAALQGQISPDPLTDAPGNGIGEYIAQHHAESAYLLNPYFDDPSVYLAYEVDDNRKEVTIVPAAQAYAPHVRAAEENSGLNRLELKQFRYQIYTKFRTFKRSMAFIDDPDMQAEIQAQIQEMMAPDYLFAGMNRFFHQHL